MKKVYCYVVLFLIIIVSSINIYIIQKETQSTDLGLFEITKAHAEDAEWGGWANFFQGQGFWKDEREVENACPTSASSSVSVSYDGVEVTVTASATYSSASYQIECASGSENCTPVDC